MNINPINGSYDQAARDGFKVNPASAFSWFLSSSYAYYLKYESLLKDETFDKLCSFLLENYDKLEHQHKHLVTKGMLKAGTAHNLKEEDYPLIVRISSSELIEKLNLWRNMEGGN